MPKFKLGEVIDAIEKNGLAKAKFSYLRLDNEGKAVSGCAIGQAARNLNVDADRLAFGLSRHMDLKDNDGRSLDSQIFVMNDEQDLSLKRIANTLRERYSNQLDAVIEVR